MSSLTRLHLSPSNPDARAQSLSSLGLFIVKSFFLALSNLFVPVPFFPTNFVQKSQVPFYVKSFAQLVVHKKVNTNGILQLRRSYKALNPDICMLYMKHRESVDHLFLHCSLTLGLWHKLFRLTKLDQVPPRSICHMVTILFKGLGSSNRGLVPWHFAYPTLIWVAWGKKCLNVLQGEDFG